MPDEEQVAARALLVLVRRVQEAHVAENEGAGLAEDVDLVGVVVEHVRMLIAVDRARAAVVAAAALVRGDELVVQVDALEVRARAAGSHDQSAWGESQRAVVAGRT